MVGYPRDAIAGSFQACEVAGRITNRYGIENEETRNYPEILVCRGLRVAWPEFWRSQRHFG